MALNSICLIRSLETFPISLPISSKVFGTPSERPNLNFKISASLSVKLLFISLYKSCFKAIFLQYSNGFGLFLSATKSPIVASSSSPTGFSNDIGIWYESKIDASFSLGIPVFLDISS